MLHFRLCFVHACVALLGDRSFASAYRIRQDPSSGRMDCASLRYIYFNWGGEKDHVNYMRVAAEPGYGEFYRFEEDAGPDDDARFVLVPWGDESRQDQKYFLVAQRNMSECLYRRDWGRNRPFCCSRDHGV
eukprot:TRINITY_DN48256_c0_g1_i1.p1 TRINITY_DN48256_c0_g1~~TRINITY_DN48256_c0_g1_i1.p1  ORF type:complete len:131 (+),score=7.69 TRINITY_DN48256_c0_g1_i1:59-451(+)